MLIGYTNTILIQSYHSETEIKTLGNDLFIIRLQNNDSSEVDIIKATHITQEQY